MSCTGRSTTLPTVMVRAIRWAACLGKLSCARPVGVSIVAPSMCPFGLMLYATNVPRPTTFLQLPAHPVDVLSEAFRRHVLKLFVERELFEPEVADNMLDWLNSGFSVHDGVWLDHDDAAAHERLARTCARCPVSLERLEYDAETGTVTYTSDKADGPTAGRHTFEVTDFIARMVAHIPDKGQVLQRTHGYYANRARGERRKAAQAPEVAPADAETYAATSRGSERALAEAVSVEPANFSRADARRWAVLMRRIYEVDPLVCPKCGGTMRVIALIQEPKVIYKTLRHLQTKGRDARAGPWTTGPPADAAAAEAA